MEYKLCDMLSINLHVSWLYEKRNTQQGKFPLLVRKWHMDNSLQLKVSTKLGKWIIKRAYNRLCYILHCLICFYFKNKHDILMPYIWCRELLFCCHVWMIQCSRSYDQLRLKRRGLRTSKFSLFKIDKKNFLFGFITPLLLALICSGII